MTVRRQAAWSLAFILGTLVCALTVGAFMQTAPGLLPLFPLAIVWWAKDLPAFDMDRELERLLTTP